MKTQDMSDCLNRIYNNIFPSSPQTVENGRLGGKSRIIGKADDALKAFTNFGGQGWLCTADCNEVQIFDENSDIQGKWPRWGEVYNSETGKSLHLRYLGEHWLLVTYSRVKDQKEPHGIITREKLLGKCKGVDRMLVYEVFYRLEEETKLAPAQYRPYNSRFIGFDKEASNG